jgi:hypothetical protein
MTNTNADRTVGRVRKAVGALSGKTRMKDETWHIDQAKEPAKDVAELAGTSEPTQA